MKRIIIHWTAGSNSVSEIDRDHYHYIVDGSGKVVSGKWNVTDNESTRDNLYAAHTLNCNTGSIGVAVAGMRDAVDRPFKTGPSPITEKQVAALARLVSSLSDEYGIPITRETVLTHAEVQPTLGIAQKGKWDIRWLPGMKDVGGAIEVGDRIRAMVLDAAKPTSKPVDNIPAPDTDSKGFWASLFTALMGIIRGK